MHKRELKDTYEKVAKLIAWNHHLSGNGKFSISIYGCKLECWIKDSFDSDNYCSFYDISDQTLQEKDSRNQIERLNGW